MKQAQSLWNVSVLISAALFAGTPPSALAQGWKPERPVEIVVSSAPGSGPDNMARLMQRVFQTNRYFEQPITIQNKVGVLGRTYLNQFQANLGRCACGGKLKFVAMIEQPEVIEKILTHLGLSPQPPPIAPARQEDLFEAA